MGVFSGLFGRQDTAKRDARRVYNLVMKQSRQPVFFGQARFPDNYDGRIDVLTLHMGIVFEALRRHGEQGNRLAQALFDEMKDDFEIALREEGISDTGVAKRIKPMIQLFYTRVKAFTESFESGQFETVAGALYQSNSNEDDNGSGFSSEFTADLTRYVQDSRASLEGETLGSLVQARLNFASTAALHA